MTATVIPPQENYSGEAVMSVQWLSGSVGRWRRKHWIKRGQRRCQVTTTAKEEVLDYDGAMGIVTHIDGSREDNSCSMRDVAESYLTACSPGQTYGGHDWFSQESLAQSLQHGLDSCHTMNIWCT